MARRRKLIVVSNRGPVTYARDRGGERIARRGGGGLVTALRSLVSHHDVTWIASAMTGEDRAVVAEAGGAAIDEHARDGSAFRLRLVAHAAGDPDVYILSNLNNVGSVEVNAFQVHSAAVIQKSIKEGFGLTVTEALWKTRPVVAGRVGGIVTQIQDGETGWLVDPNAPEECAAACIEILSDPALARQRALRGKEFVRRNFLMPRLLRDWLVLLNKLDGNDTAGAEVTAAVAAS